MGRLEYDTGAFSFFLLAIWLAGLLPLSYYAVKGYFDAEKLGKSESDASRPTYAAYSDNVFVKRLLDKKQQTAQAERAAAQKSALRKLGLVALGWAVFVAYFLSRESGADIHKFDPFEILGISASATDIEIKKAYKKLSLLYHPDRQVGKDKSEQAIAETRFIMLAKAYESLTDPIARENFQKYGNPDGRQALEMSIGLPAWLLEKENQGWVILSYLLLSIVVFPTSVMLITNNAGRTGKIPKRLYPDTEEIFRFSIQAQYIQGITSMVEAFSFAAEFRALVYRSEEEKKAILELRAQMAREDKYPLKPTALAVALCKQQPSLKGEGSEKAQVLVWAHMHRLHDRLSSELLDDLEYILSCAPIICRALIQHSRVSCNVNTVFQAILFQQHLYQAFAPGLPFLTQFPHVSEENADYFLSVLGKTVSGKTRPPIIDWFWKSKESAVAVPFLDDPKAQKDISSVLESIPVKELNVQIGTIREIHVKNANKTKDARNNDYVFEEKSAVGDFIRVICDLDEKNEKRLAENKTKKPVIAHTPFLPVEVPEEWFIIVVGGPSPKGLQHIPQDEKLKIAAFATLEDDGQSKLRADMPILTMNNGNDWIGSGDWAKGSSNIGIIALNSCYFEIMAHLNTKLTLVGANEIPKFKVHEEDERLKNEPTSLMEMLQPQAVNEVDSDFEDDDDRAARANGEDDDDEGEDAE